jgi:hypothetical protein
MKKKRPLSLLEVIIALALSAILLVTLFQFFHHLSVSNIQIQKSKGKILSRQCMHQRLSVAFNNLDIAGKTTLYSSPEQVDGCPALVWKSSQEMDSDERFRGELTHMLYFIKKRGLCFSTWSQNGASRDEVLYDAPTSMTIHFFEDGSAAGWQTEWLKKDDVPSMIKLSLYESTPDPITFVYFIQ